MPEVALVETPLVTDDCNELVYLIPAASLAASLLGLA
jgi:hypothetical protein